MLYGFGVGKTALHFLGMPGKASNHTIMDNTDLSRVLSLIISVLTDPYDQFIDKLHAEGRITDEEVQQLHLALKEQIPRLSGLVKRQADQSSKT